MVWELAPDPLGYDENEKPGVIITTAHGEDENAGLVYKEADAGLSQKRPSYAKKLEDLAELIETNLTIKLSRYPTLNSAAIPRRLTERTRS